MFVTPNKKFFNLTVELLHVFLQEFAVKVVPYCVIDEALRSLGFTTSLVLEYHIIIPSEPKVHTKEHIRVRNPLILMEKPKVF